MTTNEKLFGLEEQAAWILLGTIGLVMILLILVFVLWFRLSKLRKRYLLSIGSGTSDNVEQVLIELREQLQVLETMKTNHEKKFLQIEQQMAEMKSHVGFHRYSAFDAGGSDLSFSMALLDAGRNGVVISSLHNRDTSYVYAKPVEKGESEYKLTPEERQAIEQVKVKA